MRTQKDVLGNIVGMLTNKECILHIACGVIGSEVHLGEDVVIVLNLRTIGEHKAHARENIDNLVSDDGQRVACP